MKRAAIAVWATFFVLASCGPAIQTNGGETGAGGTRIAGSDGGSTYDAPPHKFSPRKHPPHRRVWDSGSLDLSAMPALKMRMGKCYGMYEKEDAKIAAPAKPPASRPGSGKSPGHSKTSKKKGGKKKAKRASGSAGSGYGAGAGILGGAASSGASRPAPASSAKRAEAPPATPSAPAGPPPSYAPEPDMAAAAPAMEMAEAEEAPMAADMDDEMMIAGSEDQAPEDEEFSEYEDWGAEIYLSNDDTMSLSSAQRVIYTIDNFLPLPLEHIRPHELLNYFSFETQAVGPDDDFSVLADIAPDPREDGIYSLAMSVRGREVTRDSRRNAAITWVVDRSGSMQDEGRMEYLKRGLKRSLSELKRGDMVHMVLFDHDVCTPVENFVVGRDDMTDLERAIDALRPMGATDIHRGLSRAYEIADRSYLPEHSNRVVLITDALTNTGVTDERMISMISKYYDSRRIRLSGVGVGRDFNDSLLDRLTERGKGAYVFLGSEAEVDAVFGSRFISLIETTALDVHFLLHLPESLRMNVFYGEESSTVKEDVQAIHYFANTSQLFLSDLMARGGQVRPEDDVMMTIEYQDPETGDELFEEYAFNLGDAAAQEGYNVRKGRLIMAWIDLLAQMAARPVPPVYRNVAGAWEDADGWQACADGREELERLSEGLEGDSETTRVLDLWEKYCSRYERPRNPVKRQVVRPDSSWPGAEAGDPR